MSSTMAWDTANATRTRQIASDAARRAGMTLEEWLDEAIVVHAAHEGAEGLESETRGPDWPLKPGARGDEARPSGPAEEGQAPAAQELLEAAVSRIERSLVRNMERTLRALESLKRPRQDKTHPPAEPAPNPLEPSRKPIPASPRLDLNGAVSEIVVRRRESEARAAGDLAPHHARSDERGGYRSLERDLRSSLKAPQGGIRALVRKLDHVARANAELTSSAAGVATMRAEIAEIRRALADVAPRNAIVALEGAVRDLTQRVEILRQNGHREALLAPLDAMAAELHAALKAHDPQMVAQHLERDIRAIGAKIESLSESAIKPETLERIRAQTEEVRNLLAAAAMRAGPAERLERQIAELADRVEQLGASAAPQAEIHHLAAALADLRKDIELRTPLPALASIERRLERVAARLDQELARPVPQALDERPFEDLARRIDGVREVVQARSEPTPEAEQLAASVKALNARLESPSTEPLAELMREISAKLDAAERTEATPVLDRRLADIVDKLDRMPQTLRGPAVDVRPLVEALHALEAKLAAPPPPALDRDAAERFADAVARRFEDLAPNWAAADVQGLVDQLVEIHDRLDAISSPSRRSDALEPLVRELLVKLRETQAKPGELGQKVELGSVAAELSEMRLEGAKADQNTQARLKGLEQVLDRLVEQAAVLGPGPRSGVSGPPPQAKENAAGKVPPAWGGGPARGARPAEPRAAASDQDEPMSPTGEEFLLEPGQGAPKRVQDARDAQAASARTTAALSAHIAAARRASQAAAELGAMDKTLASAANAAPARPLFAGQRRYALLALALAALVAAAVRFGGHELVALHKSAEDAGAAKSTEKPAAPVPSSRAFDALGARADVRSVDVTPTATIGPTSQPPRANAATGSSVPDLPPAVPAGAPQALRDAATAGVPSAEYELGSRLYDGRGGLSQDQRAAALWFERAAQSGFAPAQFRIAALYQKGVGVARDEAAAKRWYSKAAEAGNARAAHNLAVMDAEPADGPPDYAEAAKWFRKAAELGVRDSQFNLAVLYVRGLGVERDFKQAWTWFSLAAQQGDADAARKRDEVAAKMDPASLAAAIDELSKFRAAKPDPAANQVESPPGGWDASPGSPPASLPPFGQSGQEFPGAARLAP